MPGTSAGRPRSSPRISGLHDLVSCDVLPEYREYERAVTTLVDAFVKPHMGRYLERIRDGFVPACARSRSW